MKKIFRIKWENIMVISLIITSLYGSYSFILFPDIYTLCLSLITIVMTIVITFNYKSIKEARKITLSLWQ